MRKMTLRAARVNAGLRQEDVSKKLLVNRIAVSNWECGKTGITDANFQRVCSLYGVKPKEVERPLNPTQKAMAERHRQNERKSPWDGA